MRRSLLAESLSSGSGRNHVTSSQGPSLVEEPLVGVPKVLLNESQYSEMHPRPAIQIETKFEFAYLKRSANKNARVNG